jgi:single-strand DNA-binding protein
VQKYLHKGDLIYVEGKLQTRSWEDKEGNKKYTTEINVTDIKGIQTGDGGQNKPQAAAAGQKAQTRQTAAPAAIADEDIPF